LTTDQFSAARSRTDESQNARLLTPQEVADLLGVPISWVYKRSERAASNRLPHIKLGKYLRFERAALERWIEQRAASCGR